MASINTINTFPSFTNTQVQTEDKQNFSYSHILVRKCFDFEIMLNNLVNRTERKVFARLKQKSIEDLVYSKCKEVINIFQILHYCIKAATESFSLHWGKQIQNNEIKQKALTKIFLNQYSNMLESFKIWRKQSFVCVQHKYGDQLFKNHLQTYFLKQMQDMIQKNRCQRVKQVIRLMKNNYLTKSQHQQKDD